MAKVKSIYAGWDKESLWKYVKGEGQWNSFIKADEYDKWSTNLYGEEVEGLEEELQQLLDDAVEFAKEQGKVVKNIADLYKEYDGKRYIQFKRVKYDDDTLPPKLYNVSGEEITGQRKLEPGGGSTVKVRALIKPYYMASTKTVGLSYKFTAVQIIKDKQYEGGNGFSDESGEDNPPFNVSEEVDY